MEPTRTPPAVNRLLFIAASGFADPEERRAFLEFACRGDEMRRKRLEVLLEARRDAEEFFEVQPAVEVTANPGDEGDLGARIGPYRLIDRLGSGGCGVVYLAEQREPVERKVALKVIRLGMDTDNVVARFAAEREALALMKHPNIARVLDGGATATGRPYFVMELVDGEKITDFCDRHRLSLQQRLALFIQVCEAIQHAHQKGVVHRDIKPSNVLVRDVAGRHAPKVIDFGIAKATAGNLEADETHTRPGNFLGTPAYMSPEQSAGGVDIDTRSDIYSLGALLCELLTGRPPFQHERFTNLGVAEIRSIHADEETGVPSENLRRFPAGELEQTAALRGTDPQRLRAQLAGDLDWIIMKALEKDRKRRYQTANGLSMDVQRYLGEQPVLARPPSRGYLLMKLIRRNRIVFAAGTVTLCGLMLGFGVSTSLFLSEREARNEQARLHRVAEQARAVEAGLRENAQAAERLTQAAVLVRHGDLEGADRLLSRLEPARIPLSLEAADTLEAVANWNLLQARWQPAAERFSALVPVITSIDLTNTDRMSRILMPAATAIKEWGDAPKYERLRALALRRFGDTANDGVAAQVVKSLLLEPADPETLSQLRPLGNLLQTYLEAPDDNKSAYLLAWRHFSMGLLSYREDDLAETEESIGKSLATNIRTDHLVSSNHILLAMVRARQQRFEEARELTAAARAVIERWEAQPFVVGSSTDFWFDWVNARILLREAEAMQAAAAR